jgi:hypothetical protein
MILMAWQKPSYVDGKKRFKTVTVEKSTAIIQFQHSN